MSRYNSVVALLIFLTTGCGSSSNSTAEQQPTGPVIVPESNTRLATTLTSTIEPILPDSTSKTYDLSGKGSFVHFGITGQVKVLVICRNKTTQTASVCILDPQNSTVLCRVEHPGHVATAAFAPDGKRFITTSYNGTATVWLSSTGKEVYSLKHGGEIVERAVFSPDGTRIVTAGDNGAAAVWDATTGEEITRVNHKSAINHVAFAPEGKRIGVYLSFSALAQAAAQ